MTTFPVRVEILELPPQMRSLPCSTDHCQGQTAAMLLKILVGMDAYWQPVCSQHGSQAQNVALQIKSMATAP
jgi:hypothetical protein